MKTIPITAELREGAGKGNARSTRRDGKIPGILYGQGKSVRLSVNRKEFLKAMHDAHGENVIFDVTVPGQAPLKSIAREVQHHPVTHATMHVDFQHIDMSKKIHVDVAVHLVGEPIGVKTYGGILEHVARELEVLCLPADIPSAIEIDVSEMNVGESIHVRELPVAGYEFLADGSQVVVHIASPTVEAVPTAEEAEAAAAAAATPETAKASDGGDKS
jgi:large subunit ribosomal protein L25